jgi:hypothetical protein
MVKTISYQDFTNLEIKLDVQMKAEREQAFPVGHFHNLPTFFLIIKVKSHESTNFSLFARNKSEVFTTHKTTNGDAAFRLAT